MSTEPTSDSVPIHFGAVEPSRRNLVRAARKPYRTAQIKPATRDALKDVLANAADAQMAAARERDTWRELAERQPQVAGQGPMPALGLLLVGAVLGGALVALARWL